MQSLLLRATRESTLWQRESAALAAGKNVHAYLLSGEPGTGKRSFARLLAAFLLGGGACMACASPQCPACRRVLSGAHPDLYWYEKEKKSIPVADIRALTEKASITPYEGGRSVFVLNNFSSATPQAQNALLKTLEEPPESTVFILLCESTSSVLPTIISRCRRISFFGYPEKVLFEALQKEGIPLETAAQAAPLAAGSVTRALSIAQNGEAAFLSEFLRAPTATQKSLLLQKQKDKLPKLLDMLLLYYAAALREAPGANAAQAVAAVRRALTLLNQNVNPALVADTLSALLTPA